MVTYMMGKRTNRICWPRFLYNYGARSSVTHSMQQLVSLMHMLVYLECGMTVPRQVVRIGILSRITQI